MNVRIDNSLVIRGHRSGQRVEVEVVEGVLGLPLLVQLATHGSIEVAHKEFVAKAPTVALVAVKRTFFSAGGVTGGVQAVRC